MGALTGCPGMDYLGSCAGTNWVLMYALISCSCMNLLGASVWTN